MSARRVAALLALAGCGDSTEVFAEPRTIELTFPSVPNRQLDLLFVIDDSASVSHLHTSLAAAIGPALEELRAVSGVLPDLHVGVVTSDLGTMGSDDPSMLGPAIGQIGNGGCVGAGDDGRLQTFGGSVTGAFVSDESDGAGGRRTNYTGELPAVLGAMFQGVGSGGCGFEQPHHATRRALVHTGNEGFLRPVAHLGIVFLADEDDCSFRDPGLLTQDTSELGPLQSFRCTEHGVQCDQPLTEIGSKTGCRAREDSAYVEGIEITRRALSAAKANPSLLTVAAIVGVPEHFVVELRAPPGGGTGQRAIQHSCGFTGSDGLNVADPAIRTIELVHAFAGRGVVTSVCNTDLGPSVRGITRLLKHPLGVVCLDSARLTDSSTERGIQPACELTEIDGESETTLRDFEITADPAACVETADHLRLIVRGASMSPSAYIRARCETPY